MEIDNVILGLIKINGELTGYELNGILRDSNRYFLSVSLSYIYPILKRLYRRGLVTYTNIPLTNRPDKKAYQITTAGEQALQEWLTTPVEPDMYFRSFLVKMQFASLMSRQAILEHIEREIARLEGKMGDMSQLSNCINSGKLDQKSSDMLSTISRLLNDTDRLRVDWLKEWKSKIEESED